MFDVFFFMLYVGQSCFEMHKYWTTVAQVYIDNCALFDRRLNCCFIHLLYLICEKLLKHVKAELSWLFVHINILLHSAEEWKGKTKSACSGINIFLSIVMMNTCIDKKFREKIACFFFLDFNYIYSFSITLFIL